MSGLLAQAAQGAHQPLRLEGAHGRGDHEGLDAHVDQTGDAADGVIGMQRGENQVTCERATDGDLHRLLVAHFPHHDHVRIAAQNAAQSGGKGQVDLRLHRDLDDAIQLVFHRVFDGHDAALLRVQLLEEGVKRGRLAGARGACHQNDAVWRGQQFADGGLRGGVQPDGLEVKLFARKQSQRHGLSIHAGDGGHAHVDGLSVQLQVDTAVLRQPALGDVQMRHDLEAGNQRGLEQPHVGRHRHLQQLAVHAVADSQVALQRLHVDVRGALFECFTEDLVHKVEHRGLLVGLVQHGGLLLQVVVVVAAFAAFQQFLKVFRPHAVALVQGLQDAVARGDLPVHALAQLLAHGLTSAEVKGVVGQEGGLPAGHLQRADAVAQRQLGGEVVAQALRALSRALLRVGHAQAGGQLGKEAVLVHHAAVHQRIHQRLAVVRGQLQGMAQACGLLAPGAGGRADKNIDQSR